MSCEPKMAKKEMEIYQQTHGVTHSAVGGSGTGWLPTLHYAWYKEKGKVWLMCCKSCD
jgi:hypothetical protein